MKRMFIMMALSLAVAISASAQAFKSLPSAYKWISPTEAVFSRTMGFNGDDCFSVTAPSFRVTEGVKAPEKYTSIPVRPEGAVNLRFSPDSTMLAFTRANDLWVVDIATKKETRLTFDGTDLILNGYASWVYYEEILGRGSQYCAFWWSPDSKKLGFYRFDNSEVPMFPIYSPFGQDGKLNLTRYPKAGEKNPEVKIGIIRLEDAFNAPAGNVPVVWADFNEKEDQYFGIPFWGADSEGFYIARQPRIQQQLDLYRVNAKDGSKSLIYHETYPTWLDWIEGMVFTEKGLYMARSFETGWEQIYFLSYDGKELRRLTDGPNWRVNILRVDEKAGNVFFTAQRDAMAKSALYKVDKKGEIKALTDTSYSVSGVKFSPDGKYFIAQVSNLSTPTQLWMCQTDKADLAWKSRAALAEAKKTGKKMSDKFASTCYKVGDMRGPDFNPADYPMPQMIFLTTEDGFRLPATITYPMNFDPSKKYPVHVSIYGGPNTAYVSDRWSTPSPNNWWSVNGIINITCDSRVAGHNGRAGTDFDHRYLTEAPINDFVAWGKYLQSLPYVQADKIGVEGFSFGGTNTTLLLCEHSDVFHYGIAGGGVYDWLLYDSHYTERYMETPQANPDGYEASKALNSVAKYPVAAGKADGSVMLKITHGTGDDNVHFQNTLQLIDKMQEQGKEFELMIYPDGMHGYRGYQGTHSTNIDRGFWLKYLKGQK